MKDINYYILILFATLVMFASCQDHYDMVAPPYVEDNDDRLEDEDFGDNANDLFVSQYGDGDMNGSSWDNAIDADGLLNMLTDISTDLSKSVVRVASGTYYMSTNGVMGAIINKNIKAIVGGYSDLSQGTDLSKFDPEKYPTIFSGDINHNNVADEGDCSLLIVNGGISHFENINFTFGYISEKTASAKKSCAGIFVDGTPETVIELVNCKINKCYNAATTNSYGGGAACYIMKGQARMNNVQLTDNHGTSRGGAVRLADRNAMLMMNKCFISGNKADKDWGAGIQVSDGTICVTNSTIINNKCGYGGAQINGAGAQFLANNTIIGDAADAYGCVRCESKPASMTTVINNIFLTDKADIGYLVNGAANSAVSCGYNISSCFTGNINPAVTDVVTSAKPSVIGTLTTDNVYKWDADKLILNANAKLSEVVDALNKFVPDFCPISNYGSQFLAWCTEDGLAEDMLGNKRNRDAMLPGSFDNNGKTVQTAAMKFNVSFMTLGSESPTRTLDSFGLIIDDTTNPANSYTKKMMCSDNKWIASDGAMLLWNADFKPVTVIAYYPYIDSATANGKVSFSVNANQKNQNEIDASDFLLYKSVVDPKLTNSALNVEFQHLMSQLTVKVTLNGEALSTSSLSNMSILGISVGGTCDFSAENPSFVADNSDDSIEPKAMTDNYLCMMMPQTSPANKLSVSFMYDGRNYIWSNPTEYLFEAGKANTIVLNISSSRSNTNITGRIFNN